MDFISGVFLGFIFSSFIFEPIIINFVYLSNVALFNDIILFKKSREKLHKYYSSVNEEKL